MAAFVCRGLRHQLSSARSVSTSTKKLMKGEDPVLLGGYGALLGLFVGDAAGAPLKYRGPVTEGDARHAVLEMRGGDINSVGRGQVIDSSEVSMAMAMGLAGHDPNKGFPIESVVGQYIAWRLFGPFDLGRALGEPFCLVLRHGKVSPGRSMRKAAIQHNAKCENNEALQGVVPLSIWVAAAARYSAPSLLADMAAEDAELTHPSDVVQGCNAAYAIALQHLLLKPGDAQGTVAAAEEHVCSSGATCLAEVRVAVDDVHQRAPRKDMLRGHVARAPCLHSGLPLPAQCQTLPGGHFHDGAHRGGIAMPMRPFSGRCTSGGIGRPAWCPPWRQLHPAYMQHPVLACHPSTCRPSQPCPPIYSLYRIHQLLKGLLSLSKSMN
ncbi:hypothetical protein L7F22_045227 [Adiantum nelumboides]|nr:hypothetical protein [Adiantum nelumboides]